MEGIALCLIGLVCGVIALICALVPHPPRWGVPIVWLAVMGILYGFALLWGNVGVIYSHAGFTG
jgi:hypothetical protein